MKTFLVIDGNALLHRAWHAIPPLTAPDGTVVNALYGFTNAIDRLRSTMKPDYVAVAWDLPGDTFRHTAFEAYKAQRKEKEQELYDQIPLIQEMLTLYGIPSLSSKGFEADDVIATLAEEFGKKDLFVKILTGDKDIFQLIRHGVEVVSFVKGLSETKVYDTAAVKERFGFDPIQMVTFKALAGDPSDNIPGIAGIGEKAANELIAQFGDISGILKAMKTGEIPAKYQKKLMGQEKNLRDMETLVTLVRNVDLDGFKIAQAEIKEPNPAPLVEAFRKYGFKTLLKKYESADVGAVSARPDDPVGRVTRPTTGSRRTSQKPAAAANRKLADFKNADRVVLYIESAPQDLFGSSTKTIVLADQKGAAVIEHPKKEQIAEVLDVLGTAKIIIGHGLKAAFHVLEFAPSAELFDTEIAAYLLAPGTRSFDLSTVAYDQLRMTVTDKTTSDQKAKMIWMLADALTIGLKKEEMLKLAQEIEMPLLPVLYRMEREGICVNREKLAQLQASFAKTLESLTKKIYKATGKEFNINSPSQLAGVLFDDLQLPTKGIKKTQSGFSTAANELEKLWEAHKVIPMISEYREVAKLQSTYAESLPRMIAADGRIHTTYNQTIAATGRLSSVDPNLQNIPIRTELGNEIRKAFVPREGYTLLSADYSQFELRLASVIAKDEPFMRAFCDGADIHRRTAAEILGKKEGDVTSSERAAAKAINFGVLYGMGPRNLGRSTGMSMNDAKVFLEKYFAVHHRIKTYMDEMKTKAHVDGYVETLFGRRRYLPDIHSGMQMLVAAAERMAINMPIQGTQADLIKMAMMNVDAWIRKGHEEVKMLLQVHDELVFEVPKKEAKKLAGELKDIMQGVYPWAVPLIVDVEEGPSWGETEKFV